MRSRSAKRAAGVLTVAALASLVEACGTMHVDWRGAPPGANGVGASAGAASVAASAPSAVASRPSPAPPRGAGSPAGGTDAPAPASAGGGARLAAPAPDATDDSALTPRVKPPGSPPSPLALKLADVAQRTQRFGPVGRWSVYLVGAHALASDPNVQFLAFHYCQFSTADFMQCAIYDSNRPDANLTGVEYVVSGRTYGSFGREERRRWHPHNFEILSGMELAPGLPPRAQRALMALLLNSYGKTWQTWLTTNEGADEATDLPVGEPTLAWSVNHADDALHAVVAERNSLGPSMQAEARARRGLVPLAHGATAGGEPASAVAGELAAPRRAVPVGFGGD